MKDFNSAVSHGGVGAIEINKCLKNTYMLLGLSLVFSGFVAWLSMQMGWPRPHIFLFLGAFFGLNWFINANRNSALGLVGVFALTGFLGYAIGPTIGYYLNVGATDIVMAAMGTTGVIFLALSAYVLVTRKNFQFLGGMLAVGTLAIFLLMLGNFFFFQMGTFALALSAVWVILMSGWILYDTSDIIHGRQTNYIMATTSMFVTLYNMFSALLHLFGVMGGDD